MINLTKDLVESFGLSIFFVALIFSLVLLGILISEYSRKKILKRGIFYFLIVLIVFIIHILLDTNVYFFDNHALFGINIFWIFVFALLFSVVIYLLWKKLNKFWVYFSLLFVITCIIADNLFILYHHIFIFEILHFFSMFAIFIGMYFLIIKFLINNSERKK